MFVTAAELGGIRTVLNVPMLKENKLVGAFIVSRQEVRPFTDKQIELAKNFAAQALSDDVPIALGRDEGWNCAQLLRSPAALA